MSGRCNVPWSAEGSLLSPRSFTWNSKRGGWMGVGMHGTSLMVSMARLSFSPRHLVENGTEVWNDVQEACHIKGPHVLTYPFWFGGRSRLVLVLLACRQRPSLFVIVLQTIRRIRSSLYYISLNGRPLVSAPLYSFLSVLKMHYKVVTFALSSLNGRISPPRPEGYYQGDKEQDWLAPGSRWRGACC